MGRKILFVTTDQQRYDSLGCNGGTIARTPVVDRLAADGITANGICPGYVRTDLIERQIADLAAQRGEAAEAVAVDMLAEKHPSGRFVEIEQVAALALFLCSDAAASITGALLPVDGGWTAR